ncbi:sigma-54-dependent Fis family transcriptional regulator, partial [bacterium]|nr:sigma-54-dependent Fis family transcriptional regulator [candidate division CSSED10-310 bacterium]
MVVMGASDTDDLAQRLVDRVVQLTGAERVILFRHAGGGLLEEYRARITEGLEGGYSRGVIERAMNEGMPLLIRDIGTDSALAARDSIRAMDLRTVLAVPLRSPERSTDVSGTLPAILGLLYADSRIRFRSLDERHLAVLEILANHAAVSFINHALRERLEVETESYRREVAMHFPELIGESVAMRNIAMMIDRLADKDIRVLITGETGTGKDLVARLLHGYGIRKHKPFVHLDCTAIPDTLLESELFGIEKGVATGVNNRSGVFEWAADGVIFLDHVEDIPSRIQAKLLRVLQEGRFNPVGSTREIDTNARIISASRSSADSLLTGSTLRDDLYYRLNGVTIALPPLRERLEDVPLLAAHFLAKYSTEVGREIKGFSRDALTEMVNYGWPGNIRELENRIRRAVVMSPRDHREITAMDLPIPMTGSRVFGLKQQLDRWESEVIRDALVTHGGSVTDAARALGISRMAMTRLASKHDIDVHDIRLHRKPAQ